MTSKTRIGAVKIFEFS